MRDRDPEKGENIKHYRLARTDAGQYYFDLTKKPKYFHSLAALVLHFAGARAPQVHIAHSTRLRLRLALDAPPSKSVH